MPTNDEFWDILNQITNNTMEVVEIPEFGKQQDMFDKKKKFNDFKNVKVEKKDIVNSVVRYLYPLTIFIFGIPHLHLIHSYFDVS